MKKKVTLSSLRIAGLYALISTMWIVMSDTLLSWIAKDYYQRELFQTIKGIFFVAATSCMLYAYSKTQMSRLLSMQSAQEREALASLKEKELLLREIHHRVKNNLQIIVSLLSLHTDKDDGLEDLKSKIRSMALVHELLYSSEGLSSLRADEFATRLATLLVESYGEHGVSINGHGDPIYIKVEKAVPIGIFVSEACANAVKHARISSGVALAINIGIRLQDGSVVVEVRDDGKGLGLSLPDSPGLGSTLMAAVAEQAGGTLKQRDEGGAIVWFAYPAD